MAIIAIPILIFTIFNNVSLDAVINNDNFVVNNFNFNDQIGLITVGLTVVLFFGCLKNRGILLIIYASIKTSTGH
jgi:hypothetical protein